MRSLLAEKRAEIAALCRRHRVVRLEAFGSSVRGDFDQKRSDVDFLVTFEPEARNDLAAFLDLKEALEALLDRPVDLVEHEALLASRNYIRRNAVLSEAEPVYG